jgi:hypothetical protein
MTKKKFVLTSDLVKVEPETIIEQTLTSLTKSNEQIPQKIIIEKEQISLKISKETKKNFQMWCVQNSINMTEGLERALISLIKNNESEHE